jgi:hypothetical protein
VLTQAIRRLACIGALLTIVAIGIDPTMQQTLVIRQRMSESSLAASLPRAQGYLQGKSPVKIADGKLVYVPPAAMAGAMYSGLIREPGAPQYDDVVPSCRTSNCTFPLFQSLAIGSRCEDTTELITTNCTSYNWTIPINGSFVIADKIRHCHFKLPNGLDLNHTMANSHPWGGNGPYHHILKHMATSD